MVNEFGQTLDRNKYAPSIVGEQERCFICGRKDRKLDRHEAFHGSYREKSKELGCWVLLCDICHDELHHRGGGKDLLVKQCIQRVAMDRYGWDLAAFRERFGKSYI